MFKSILIPIDFSHDVKCFVPLLKKLDPKSVLLLNVIDNLEMSLYKELYLAMTASPLNNQKTSFKDSPIFQKNQEKLLLHKQYFKNNGFHVSTSIVQGVPYKQIVSKSKKEKVDLIVIPAWGKRLSLVKDVLLMGGTVTRVVRYSKIPVLVMK